jgi:hypothetical protein
VDLQALYHENPQLAERPIKALNEVQQVLQFSEGKNVVRPSDFHLEKNDSYDPSTPVYFLIVEGDGSYIVDNFVARHELPGNMIYI